MKQRSPIAATLLSLFVPFYIWYWFYATAKDLKAHGAHPPRLALLFAPLFAALIFVALLLPIYDSVLGPVGQLSETTKSNLQSKLMMIQAIGWILLFLGFICLFIYYYRFSQAAEAATNSRIKKAVAFVLFLIIAPVAVYIIQDELNKIPSNPAQPAAAPPAQPEATTPPVNPVS